MTRVRRAKKPGSRTRQRSFRDICARYDEERRVTDRRVASTTHSVVVQIRLPCGVRLVAPVASGWRFACGSDTAAPSRLARFLLDERR